MMDGLEVHMVPFLTVEKGDETVDCVNLEGRDTLILGRHHSCDIEVGHVSCSRRHLQIKMVDSTQDIILTDLGSAHGTWVEGTRLGCMAPVVFKGSVTFYVAASTRAYRLCWKPVSESLASTDSFQVSEIDKKRDMNSQAPSRSQSGSRQISENQDFSGGKSNFNGKQSRGEKVLASSTLLQNENLSPSVLNSPGRKFGHLQRAITSTSSSPKLPICRLAFSSLHQPTNDKQILSSQIPRSSPLVKKGLTARATSQVAYSAKPAKASPSKQPNSKSGTSIPSELWLRRGSSAPLPALSTASADKNINTILPSAPPLSAMNEDKQSLTQNSVIVDTSSFGAAVSDKTKKIDVSTCDSEYDEEYPSDKENLDPVRLPCKLAAFSKSSECSSESISRDSSSSLVQTIERQPFRPLNPLPCTALGYQRIFDNTGDSCDSPNAEFYCRALSFPRLQHKHCPTARNLDQLLNRLKLEDSIEGRKRWHLVIDTNCLLDSESLKALKQLEGIKEVSIIIPKIVIRELDFLKHKGGLKSSARGALNWIESCMIRIPDWIYVQKSSDTLPVDETPPPSPSSNAFPYQREVMSPTNDDHILECALVFNRTIHYGKVTLLSRDTALRIKAMAEGLLSESAVEFVESLLSPYSNRFLWAGSTAHGQTWVDSPLQSPLYHDGESTTKVKSHVINHPVEELRNHISAQPRGLRVAVRILTSEGC